MPKARKKKTPVTATQTCRTSDSNSSNPHTTRTLIRRFHVLLKKQRQLQKSVSSTCNAQELRDVEREIEEMGGLAAYQHMSNIGQGADRGGGSEKVLIKWLVGMGLSKRDDGRGKLSLLEVGALRPDNYASCASWIDTTPMDLRSRHPAILEQDFLCMDANEHGERWDIVSLSLVVNFVPEPKDRGRMLTLVHTFLRPSGLLFLALPLPCVENSRYLTFEHLQSLMSAIGFVEIEKKWRQGGKMAYWLYRKVQPDGSSSTRDFRKKSICREGKRNNFCILLK
ncbi:nucleolus protein [Melanogaster broomeanus]|nr:nucleolus protein [Melanogaster broomeanus]